MWVLICIVLSCWGEVMRGFCFLLMWVHFSASAADDLKGIDDVEEYINEYNTHKEKSIKFKKYLKESNFFAKSKTSSFNSSEVPDF